MQKTKLKANDIGILFFLAALIFGCWFRLRIPAAAGFPISDGALFYRMIETVQENHFRLPVYVEFNELQIPFAYPPLAFYLAGAIGAWFHVPTLQLSLWLPAIVLCLTLPVFFLLAQRMLDSTLQAGMATFIYALTPRTLTWLIMGGGVTRSLGNLFLMLAALQLYLLFTQKQPRFLYGSIVFSALVCLTHPEATIHTVIVALLLWGLYGRDQTSVRNALIVGAGVLVCIAPWLFVVWQRFGLEPFLAASQTGLHVAYSWIYIFNDFSEEPFMTVIGVLAVLGAFVQIAKKQYFLPLWYFLPFLVEPRNAPNVYVIPVALLAATSLTDLILPGIAALQKSETRTLFQTRAEKLLMAYVAFALVFGMLSFQTDLSRKRLSPDSLAAFEWIKDNTPADAEFLIITGDVGVFSDYVNEWFPLLTSRRSQTTLQGYEWIAGVKFVKKVGALANLQLCVRDGSPRACIETAANRSGFSFDYVLIQKDRDYAGNLSSDLLKSADYRPVRESQTVVIFKRSK